MGKYHRRYNKHWQRRGEMETYRKSNDIVISKGKKVQHISSKKDINLSNSKMYVAVKNEDKSIYKAAMGRELVTLTNKLPYKHLYTTTEDLKIPSKDKCYAAFEKVYSAHKKILLEMLMHLLIIMVVLVQ